MKKVHTHTNIFETPVNQGVKVTKAVLQILLKINHFIIYWNIYYCFPVEFYCLPACISFLNRVSPALFSPVFITTFSREFSTEAHLQPAPPALCKSPIIGHLLAEGDERKPRRKWYHGPKALSFLPAQLVVGWTYQKMGSWRWHQPSKGLHLCAGMHKNHEELSPGKAQMRKRKSLMWSNGHLNWYLWTSQGNFSLEVF